MLGRIIKRDRAIEMHSRIRDVPGRQQGHAHETMPYHERNGRPLPLCERQELRRKLAYHVALERDVVRDPQAVENRKLQQRILGGLSKRLRLFDQQTRLLNSRFGFGSSVSFDMDKRSYKGDLKLDLLAAQGRCRRQGRHLGKGTGELSHCLQQRRARKRPLSRLPPQARRLLDQPRLGAVTSHQFRLTLCDLHELALKGFGNSGVQRASWLAQERAISRVLYERVLEQVGRLRRRALPEQ